MKLITITESVYTTLMDAAKEQLNDIESGVEEGIYEDSDENKKTVEAIRKALDYQPTVDEVSDDPTTVLNKHGKKLLKALKTYISNVWDLENNTYRHALLNLGGDQTQVNLIVVHPNTLTEFHQVTGVPAEFPAELANGIMHVINTGIQPEEMPIPMPTFFRKDLSGRDGSYPISFDDLIKEEEEEIEENEEFADWLYNAEVGDEYTEFNNCTYTRIS